MSRAFNPNMDLRTGPGQRGGQPFYTAFGQAYTAYANPTDIIGIRGAAGKIINVRQILILSQSTVQTLMFFNFYRRSALNTNGTPTALTPAKYDSRDPAPSAGVRVYGALPIINDGAAPLISVCSALTNLLTVGKASIGIGGSGLGPTNGLAVDVTKTLHVLENEELVVNLGAAALPGGFTSCVCVQWSETDL